MLCLFKSWDKRSMRSMNSIFVMSLQKIVPLVLAMQPVAGTTLIIRQAPISMMNLRVIKNHSLIVMTAAFLLHDLQVAPVLEKWLWSALIMLLFIKRYGYVWIVMVLLLHHNRVSLVIREVEIWTSCMKSEKVNAAAALLLFSNRRHPLVCSNKHPLSNWKT